MGVAYIKVTSLVVLQNPQDQEFVSGETVSTMLVLPVVRSIFKSRTLLMVTPTILMIIPRMKNKLNVFLPSKL